MFIEIFPGCLNSGVCCPVYFIHWVEGNCDEKTSQMSIRRAPDGDTLRLSLKPIRGEPGSLFAFVRGNHFKDYVLILRLHRLGQDTTLELKERADDRIFAVQIDQVEQGALLRHATALFDIGSVISTRTMMQLAVPIRVAPVQVRHNRFTRQIVREKSLRAGLNK